MSQIHPRGAQSRGAGNVCCAVRFDPVLVCPYGSGGLGWCSPDIMPAQAKRNSFWGADLGPWLFLQHCALWRTEISSSILGVVGGQDTKQMNVQPEAGSL